MFEHRGYYGTYSTDEKPTSTLGIYLVDEAYKRILDKHEEELIKRQTELIVKFKNSIPDDMKIVESGEYGYCSEDIALKKISLGLFPHWLIAGDFELREPYQDSAEDQTIRVEEYAFMRSSYY